jgi:2,3,4,5-tetrahydropyridine-2-carboxylate N-succinyltransferase
MDLAQLETEINAAWDNRDAVTASTKGAVRDAVAAALALLDSGTARVAESGRRSSMDGESMAKKSGAFIISSE